MTADDKSVCFINGVQYKCRTCFDPGRTIVHLTHEANNSKTWGDLLRVIAKLQTNNDELLPNTLCCKCSEKLKRSYDFILQIQNANEKYSQLLANIEAAKRVNNFTDCLAEPAIILPLEKYMPEVKVEEESDPDITNNKQLDEDKEEDCEKEDNNDPFTERYEEDIMPAAEQLEDHESLSSRSPKTVAKSKVAAVNELIERVSNNSFRCRSCKKTYTVRRSCRRHIINAHFKETKKKGVEKNLCPVLKTASSPSSKNVKTFECCIYSKPTAWRLVECKLCNINFNTCKDLRHHFENHNDIKTLHNLKPTDNIVKYLFPNLTSLEHAKQKIIEDIAKKRWFKYYNVLNKYSYEMSISDTEVEELENANAKREWKYKCTLCYKKFLYKFQGFAHLKEIHNKEKITLKCDRCKLEFISVKMYKQHLQTHCNNEHKHLFCQRCPAKFFWPENLKNHNCPTATPATSASNYQRKLERNDFQTSTMCCCLCNHTFEKLRHLRQHISLHADGKTGIDFQNCIYVKQFESSESTNKITLQEQIQTAFSKHQISRFYQAVDKFGNEIDISDSDSDNSTEEGESKKQEKNYKCEVCNEVFDRRKYLLKHQLERHEGVQMPFTCKDCNQQYVNFQLLQQHIKRQCCNEDRRIAPQCEFCSIRFIWPSNMLKHKEMQHHVPTESCGIIPLTGTSNMKVDLNTEHFALNQTALASQGQILNNKELDTNENESINTNVVVGNNIKISASVSSLPAYEQPIPETENKFVCSLCSASFSNNSEFKTHIKRHIQCAICEESFSRQVELNAHIRKHMSRGFYKCTDCPKLFTKPDDIKTHFLTHSASDEFSKSKQSENPTKNIWNKKLKSNNEELDTNEYGYINSNDTDGNKLKILESISSSTACGQPATDTENKFVCSFCRASFPNNADLNTHMTRHTKCAICDETFSRQSELNTHIRKHMSRGFYKCTTCPKLFTQPADLKTHFETHSTPDHNKVSENPATSIYNKNLCPICGTSLSKNTSFTQHMRMHSNERRHKCEYCEKAFVRRTEFLEHIRIHTNERPFKCTHCGKSFITKTRLRNHIRVHTGERPYQCKICMKTYIISSRLKFHMLSHTGEKRYSCEICGQDFICGAYLKKHRILKGHHEEKKITDEN